MIDPSVLKAQLHSLPTRSTRRYAAELWGTGEMGLPDDLLPDVNENVRATLRRLASMAQSLGPRIVQTKRFGVLGDITWGGDDTRVDQLLRDTDLEGVATEMFDDSRYSGMLTGVVRTDPDLNIARIEPLVGHVEPVYSPHSPTLVMGLLHAWLETTGTSGTKWAVRLYDLHERTMREWRMLHDPTSIIKTEPSTIVEPSSEYPDGAPTPRFAILNRDANRMPQGEMARLLPLLFADWSAQVRGSRIEESTAIPQLVVSGEVEDGTSERSPTHVIRLLDNGDAKYLVPGDMSTLHDRHDRILERIREDGNLPGGFLGSQTPSGEALREANAKFISANRSDATRLGMVLTQLAQDLARANGIDANINVSVSINREFTRQQDIEDGIKLYTSGLAPLDAIVRHLHPFLPSWSDEDLEAFLQSQAELVPPDATPVDMASVVE